MWTLFKHYYRQELRSLRGWTLLLGLTTLLLSVLALRLGNLQQTLTVLQETLNKMPAALQMVGGDLSLLTPALVVSSGVYRTIAPVFLLVFTTQFVLGIYCREASERNLEFLFSLPVRRQYLLGSRFLVFLSNLAVLILVLWIALSFGLLLGGAEVNLLGNAKTSLGLLSLFAFLGGLTFLLSLGFRDHTRGTLAAFAFQFGLFVLSVVVDSQQQILSRANPYHYYVASMQGGASSLLQALALLSVGASLAWLAGMVVFLRKQV